MLAKRISIKSLLIAAALLLAVSSPISAAWPTQTQWIPTIAKDWTYITDPLSDVNPAGHLDLVPDLTTSPLVASFWYFDGTNIYFRMILDGDPVKNRGLATAEMLPFGWNILVESTGDLYPDWSLSVDGTGSADQIHTMYNLGLDDTMDGKTGNIVTANQTPYVDSNGFQVLINGYVKSKQTTTDPTKWYRGNPDYYLDFGVPLSWFSRIGYSTPAPVTGSTPIKFAFGTGASGQTINKDLAGQSNTTSVTDFFNNVPPTALDSGGSYGTMLDSRHTSTPANMGIWYRGETLRVNGYGWPGGGIYYTGFLTLRIIDPLGAFQDFQVPVNSSGNVSNAPIATFSASAALGIYTIQVADPRNLSLLMYKDTFTVAAVDMSTSSKSVNKATAGILEELTYTITVSNTGNLAAQNVIVTDQLPGGVTYVPGSTTLNGSPVPDSGNSSGLIAGYSLGTVQPGVTHVFVLKAKVNTTAVDGTTLNNVANIAWTGGSIQRNAFTSVIAPRITISKAVDLTNALPGQVLTYTAYVLNSGSMPATAIDIYDSIPPETEYIVGSATRGGGIAVAFKHGSTGDYDTSEVLPITGIKWTVPSLGVGQSVTLVFTVLVR